MKPATHARGEAAPSPARAAAAALFRAPAEPAEPTPAIDFTPVPVRQRWDGWTAERQRTFISVLAETGSIAEACMYAGVSSRSAYRLRARPDAQPFARAWDEALRLATARLIALAFERATRGTVREIWKDGEMQGQIREPSERILIFLLQHLLPAGRPGERWGGFTAMTEQTRAAFPETLDALADNPCEMEPIDRREYFPERPGNQDLDV